uniref:J domain-containing protein n=1 Tax=Caligus clemensi TaxID=344056 RepID=C1C1B8_CALCM|nr:J domain-containing protein [Caligus clemensi]
MNSILQYEKDPSEDYYAILGSFSCSTKEQILAEYRARVKFLHPDKTLTQEEATLEQFKILSEAKSVLTDDEKRKDYDAWKSSGLAMSYKDWLRLNSSVKKSMHWAVPNTDGRMLESSGNSDENLEPVGAGTSNIPYKKEKDEALSQKRRLFAQNRGDSSLNSMVLTERITDKEMRRRFRNYEI